MNNKSKVTQVAIAVLFVVGLLVVAIQPSFREDPVGEHRPGLVSQTANGEVHTVTRTVRERPCLGRNKRACERARGE